MEKTIKMPGNIADKWLAALRSGEYTQAQEVLFNPHTNGFCCLGVLQNCISGQIIPDPSGELPDRNWLEEHNINFRKRTFYGFQEHSLSPTIFDSPEDSVVYFNITAYNDVLNTPFVKIADLIESNLERLPDLNIED